jgi:perosamine synthetase
MVNIPIFEPVFTGNEKKYLTDCIDTSWISSQGSYISKFEKALAEFHGLGHAVVTSNCTTALHLSLKALDIGPGDEVLCPNLTFIAPANMVVLAGAKLVLVDIHPETLTIDPDLLEQNITSNTKAILVVHQFGHAAHMDSIMALSRKHNLKIIEDNAESIGAKYKGKLLGTLGDVSTYSFFGNKIMTTGEGGAVLTDNPDVALKCRELRDHGMNSKKRYEHIHLGFNYRMTNMQAAIGLAQMEKLDEILRLRREQMDAYYAELDGVEGLSLRKFASWCEPVHWMMTLTLDDVYDRDDFLTFMGERGIDCRQMINPVHHAHHFKSQFKEDEFECSSRVSRQSAHLPSGLQVGKSQIREIAGHIKSFLA